MFIKGNLKWVDRFSVDVKDENGLVSRGLLRDIVPDQGLILDFDCPGHRADFVPFGKYFQPARYGDSVQEDNCIRPGDSVEVLLQRSRDEPWYWYSAKVIPLNPKNSQKTVGCDYSLVEVDLDCTSATTSQPNVS